VDADVESFEAVKIACRVEQTVDSFGPMQSLALLEYLRRGDAQSPLEPLEVKLDGDLIGLWAFNRDIPPDKRDPHLLKLLGKIRDYRARYPRTAGNGETDQTIAEVLAWADTKAVR